MPNRADQGPSRSRRAATHTGECAGCGTRRTLNVVDGHVRGHERDEPYAVGGRAQCPGSWELPKEGTVKRRTRPGQIRPRHRTVFLTLAEQRRREFTCGYCLAPPGEACRTLVKRDGAATHSSRQRQAVAAGRLPVTDAELAEHAASTGQAGHT
jgi:hypothetical protein